MTQQATLIFIEYNKHQGLNSGALQLLGVNYASKLTWSTHQNQQEEVNQEINKEASKGKGCACNKGR